jgi:hypothetical protein
LPSSLRKRQIPKEGARVMRNIKEAPEMRGRGRRKCRRKT